MRLRFVTHQLGTWCALAPGGTFADVPELPDIAVYVDHLARRFVGGPFEGVRLASPFILRTAVPPISDSAGRTLTSVKRLGKRLVFELDRPDEARTFLVIHLMVAGRFRLAPKGAPIPKKLGLASLEFPSASVILTEAGTKRRASIHYVTGPDALAPFDRGGIEPLTASLSEWRAALTRENHTLKRALTDPRIVSGVGNGYSDEILHVARLSPLKLTNKLDDDEWRRLHEATRLVLEEWIARLTRESKDGFPENVTAFREEMRVHGKYKKPCPVCGSLVLRIVYADNETNYCAACQTDGRPLADRSMSRLLGKDWPRSLDELEELRPTLLGKPNPARSTKPVKPKRVKAES
jgi:formamidopyrimidine-DNA glycosylase